MGSTNSYVHRFGVAKSLDTGEYSLKVIYDCKKTMTDKYNGKINLFRRGTKFILYFKSKKKQEGKKLGLILRSSIGPLSKGKPKYKDNEELSYFELSTNNKNNRECLFTVDISIMAPIGWYQLYVVDEEIPITDTLPFFIIFNPLNSFDDVYTPNKELLDHYLFDTTTTIYYGSEDNFSYKVYNLDQFSIECLMISWECLCRMSIDDRKNPLKVSKAISDFVHDDNYNGLMTNKLYDISNGKNPNIWSNMIDIYREYLLKNQPVGYGSFYIYAVIITALCRCVGIICRTVTGFSINSNDKNEGLIKVVVSGNDLKVLEKPLSLWNFHCWNNVIIKSNLSLNGDLKLNEESCWHHIDGYLENKCHGRFKYGPYQIFLLKNGISKAENFNGKFIYSSLNFMINYTIVNEKGEKIKEFYKKVGGKLFVTSNRRKHCIDITQEYKESSSFVKNTSDVNKISLNLIVDKFVNLGNNLKYQINILNSSEDIKSIVSISLGFKNIHNLESNNEEKLKSFEFQTKDFYFNGEFDFLPSINEFDVSQMCYFWEIRFFDFKLNKLKILHKTTLIRPLFTAKFIKYYKKWTSFQIRFMILIKNQSKYNLKNVKIIIYMENDKNVHHELYLDFTPKGKKCLLVEFTGKPGIAKFFGIASYGLSTFKIGEISRFVNYY